MRRFPSRIPEEQTLSYLQQLVMIDSVNPDLVDGAAGESAVAVKLAAICEALGLAVELQEVAPYSTQPHRSLARFGWRSQLVAHWAYGCSGCCRDE